MGYVSIMRYCIRGAIDLRVLYEAATTSRSMSRCGDILSKDKDKKSKEAARFSLPASLITYGCSLSDPKPLSEEIYNGIVSLSISAMHLAFLRPFVTTSAQCLRQQDLLFCPWLCGQE